MNKIFSGYTPLFLIIFTLLHTTVTYGQNVPNTESQPAGSAVTFPVPPNLPSEASGQNYTRSYSPLVPLNNSQDVSETSPAANVKIATTYRDGFNRGFLTVHRNYTNNTNKHLVTPVDNRAQADAFSYLPYATSANMDLDEDALGWYHQAEMFNEQKAYYNTLYSGEGYTSFSRSQYVSDANQRAMKSYAPGKSQVGQGRGSTTKSITNDASVVRIWEINGSGLPQSNGYYPADILKGSVSTSAEGAEVTVFKDKDGKVIYQKEIKAMVPLPGSPQVLIPTYGTTYNVYDELGQLKYSIPPAANALVSGGTLTQAQLDNLCYQYSYNDKGQVTRKKLPGKAQELFIYDKMGRLALSQDGMLAPNKWNFTIYDKQNRPLVMGRYENIGITQQQLQAYFYDAVNYSAPSLFYYQKNYDLVAQYPTTITGAEILSYNYYDNYDIIDPAGTMWATYASNLQFTELMSTPGAETPERGNLIKGLVTGSKVKIIVSPGASTTQTGDWRETVNYYDNKGRAIYSVSRDMYQGTPKHTHYAGTQYDFAGRTLISKHVSANSNSADGNHYELTRNYYDANTGALTQTQHKLNNTGAWNVMALYTYDELGRVKRKVLGNYGEVRDFSYNIRGQLEGINPVYAMTGQKEGESRTFGESLKYDYGFTVPRYDGMVSGMIWRGSTAANNNAYGYRYDASGRLTTADYRKWEPVSAPYLYEAWRNDKTDYSVSNLQYDLNGNILSMKQRGMDMVNGITTPVDIDKLRYDYISQTNQLFTVYDSATVNYGTGDFQNTNGSSSDYAYNPNGSLTIDRNKGITDVTYTPFGKPQVVYFVNNKRIEYSYDAAGNKVQELIFDPSSTNKTTDYVGNFIYENNVLKHASTPEGRSVYDPTAHTFKEEFFVKDHLDNVRSVVDVYTYPILQYLASYEIASANLEGLFFDDMDEVRDDKPGSTDPNDIKAASLNGDDPARRTGTSALLKVMAGDKIELNVNNFYDGYHAEDDQPVNMEDMLASVIGTLTAGAGGFVGSETHDTKLVNDVFTMPNFQVFDQLVNQNSDGSKPKAYLNYLLFNERMELVTEMSGAFQATGNSSWTQIGTTAPMLIPENGYLAVYLSNRSRGGSDVFFDQLVVRVTSGKLKEEAHYYPFGLPIGTMGSAAAGFMPNKNKYQSNEYNKDLGLNWMDFHNRQYDPQLGRFLSIDPLAEATVTVSPYAAMDNNPASNIDPLGLLPMPRHLQAPLNRLSFSAWASGSPLNQSDGWEPFSNPNAPGGRNYAAEDAAFEAWSWEMYYQSRSESVDEALSSPGGGGSGTASATQGDASASNPTSSEVCNNDDSNSGGAATITSDSDGDGDDSGKGGLVKDEKGIVKDDNIKTNIVSELERGDLKSVQGVVLHRTASSTGKSTMNAFKQGRDGTNYGTHFLIDENGNITQTASLNKYTLHVGKTKKPYYPKNINSIGIEVVGSHSEKTGWQPLNAAQIKAATWLTGSLLRTYNLCADAVYSHDVISSKTVGEGTIIYNAIMPQLTADGL